MRRCFVLLLLAALLAPSGAFADAQNINFRCVMQFCHKVFMTYGSAFYDPEGADWTLTGGVGIRDVEQLTMLSLILANPAAPNHDAVHTAFTENAVEARRVMGSTIVNMTTSTFTDGQMAKQAIPGTDPVAYYGADALMAGYLTIGEWYTYDETMCTMKNEDLLGSGVDWPKNGDDDGVPEAEAGLQDYLKVNYNFDVAELCKMCGDYDGDGAVNCNEYWGADFTYDGTLTTRSFGTKVVDGDHGTITCSVAPAALAVGDMMDILWSTGGRYSVFISSVAGNVVGFSTSGDSNDNLPAVGTAVKVTGFRYTTAIVHNADPDEGVYWGAWTCIGEDDSSIRFRYNTVSGRVYILSQGELSFDDAFAFPGVRCPPHGATVGVRLAEIRSAYENDLVWKVASGNTAWIGATDAGKDGYWAGVLTTRTGNTTGTVTVSGTPALRNGKFIVWWDVNNSKHRRDLNGYVTGNVVTLTGGATYDDAMNLPAAGTAVNITNRPNPEDWYWRTDLSQSEMTYKNWRDGEPNGVAGGEDYATMRDDGTWNDKGKGAADNPEMEYAVWESLDTYADTDGNFQPDAFEDDDGNLIPDVLGEPWPDADFTISDTTGDMPFKVTFADTSTGNGETLTAWSWNFGDGTTSTLQNPPEHTYMVDIEDAPAKSFTVTLTVTSVNSGTDVRTSTITKTVGPVNWVCFWGYTMEDQAEVVAANPGAVDTDLAAALGSADEWVEWDLDADLLPDAASVALLAEVACEMESAFGQQVYGELDDNNDAWKAQFVGNAGLIDNAELFTGLVGLSDDMQTALGAIVGADLSGYTLYGLAKAGSVFSAGGDYDGDNLTNLQEWNLVVSVYGATPEALDVFVDAATDPHNFWDGNPMLPVAGILGLGLLAGTMLAGAALAIRKK